MDANERIKFIKEQALKLKQAKEEKKIEVTDVVVAEPSSLPATFTPSKFLSITRGGGVETPTTLLSKFEVQPEVYEDMVVTEEQGKKINKSLGRMVTGVASAVPIVCRGDACSYKETCVTGDTLVLTKKGITAIKDILPKTKVYAINTNTFLLEVDIVDKVTVSHSKPVYKLETMSGNTIKVTDNHPFLTKLEEDNYKWKTIETGLDVGSEVMVIDGPINNVFHRSEGDLLVDTILSIEYIGEEDVYDITVRNNNNFIGNNFSVHNCPFYSENIHTVGERCPIEVSLIEAWSKDFMEELNIDPNSITEVQVLSRLIEISIIERRLATYISIHDQDLTTEFVASVDPMGNEIRNKGPSIAFEQREKLDRAKMKLLESLNATRERKQKIQAQLQQEAKVDTSMLDIKNTVIEIARKMQMEKRVVGEG